MNQEERIKILENMVSEQHVKIFNLQQEVTTLTVQLQVLESKVFSLEEKDRQKKGGQQII